MKPSSIKAGGVYSGGKNQKQRHCILIWHFEDNPKADKVRYVDENNRLHDVSLAAFARWAKRKVRMKKYVRDEAQFPRKPFVRREDPRESSEQRN